MVSAKSRHFIKSQYEMLQLSMKCWNSAFNAQSSRLIIVLVQLGTLNIHVTAVEMLMKKERQGETQFTTKIDSFLSFIPPWMLLYTFSRFFLISPCVWPNSGLLCCIVLTFQITLLVEIGFSYYWVTMDIQWIVRWSVLVHFHPSVVVLSVDQLERGPEQQAR